jgi:hypothetical protein
LVVLQKVPFEAHLPVLRALVSASLISNQFLPRKVSNDTKEILGPLSQPLPGCQRPEFLKIKETNLNLNN